MLKERIKSKKLFVIVNSIVYILLLYPLINGLYNIFNPLFIVCYTISFIWNFKLLKDENKISINNVLGITIIYGFGFYMMWQVFLKHNI